MLVDEHLHFFMGRSSSAWAKNADALRRISLAWRSSRFSRSSALRRARSSLVGPARCPASRAERQTHVRKLSDEQPIFGAIDSIAAHCDR
jgi:hypothetical protein